MKRTTVYLEPDLEVPLKLESMRRKKPVAVVIREALRAYFEQEPKSMPPGAGAFKSGFGDTAERSEELLEELGFGDNQSLKLERCQARCSVIQRDVPQKKGNLSPFSQLCPNRVNVFPAVDLTSLSIVSRRHSRLSDIEALLQFRFPDDFSNIGKKALRVVDDSILDGVFDASRPNHLIVFIDPNGARAVEHLEVRQGILLYNDEVGELSDFSGPELVC